MNKKLIFSTLGLGFLSWLIPFLASFLFYKPGGDLMVPYATFKSVIMVIGTLSGCLLMYRQFSGIDGNYLSNGMITGIAWFVINIVLDALVLMPMMKTTFPEYFMSIGVGYLAIPVISISMGLLLNRKHG